MAETGLNPETKTGRIHIKILELLEQRPDGMRWVDLAAAVREADPSVHPKTLNGCIWRLTETFPDRVYKPEKGLFRLLKFKT